jgi:hypothetical protein
MGARALGRRFIALRRADASPALWLARQKRNARQRDVHASQ